MAALVWLLPVGLLVGAFGTLIGAGGGFLLVPLLLVLYPTERPETIASISLAVVFCNAASGSLAYARMRRIDYRAALILAAATVPGAVLGAISTSAVPRRAFDVFLAVVMLVLALHMSRRPRRVPTGELVAEDGLAAAHLRGASRRRFRLTVLLSFLVGYISSLLGIGGGIVHVPLLVRVLRFPVHIATATSHLVLAITALAGTIVHLVSGAYTTGWVRTVVLAVGVTVGAQFGALLSRRLNPQWILRFLALALASVGVRLLYVTWRG